MTFLSHLLATLAVAWAYFCAHVAPVLAATLLPTLIAGLTNKASAQDSKLVQLLKLAARACGFAVHYNEPGSVKLPLSELLVLAWKGAVAVYRVFKPAPTVLLLAGFAILHAGCATSATKPGATLADKIKDDQAAIQLICSDVQTQCLPQFQNPTAAVEDLAAALADAAGALGDPTLALAAILKVIDAYPTLKADAVASMCVLHVVVADIKKLQPQKSAALDRLMARLEVELSARQSLALVEVPVACQQRPDDDHGACRKVVLDCGDNTRSCFDVASR